MNPSSLIPIASLGASQATSLPEAPAECLAEHWKAIDTTDLPAAVLQAAALEQALYTTGTELLNLSSQLEVPQRAEAPVENSPQLSPASISAVIRMIRGDNQECLKEWFHLATLTEKRIPAATLPILLDYGSKSSGSRQAISQLVSIRGLWLAQQYSEWSWLNEFSENSISISDEENDASWQTGTSSQRLGYMRALFSLDNSKAAKLISTVWKDETPGFKTQLISLLQHSSDLTTHEPWLQLASNDARKEVRTPATAALLSFQSTYKERAITRAKNFLSLKGKTIQITAPEDFDKAWLTDGIKLKIAAGSTKIKGEKAGWLRQILSRVPLPDWQKILETKLPLYQLKPDPDWSELINVAQHEAALHTSDQAALLEHIKFHNKNINTGALISHARSQLDINQTYSFISRLSKYLPEHTTLSTLQSLKQPPETPQPKITTLILKHLLAKESSVYTNEARALALSIHPDEIPTTLKTISKAKILSTAAEEFANLLEFRISYIAPFQIL